MADEIQRPRTRRAVLAAAAAGAATLAVHSLGQPAETRAANGDALLIGRPNEGTVETSLRGDVAGGITLQVRNNAIGTAVAGSSLQGIGVLGQSAYLGVAGTSTGTATLDRPSIGVSGESIGNGTGVRGITDDGPGVDGRSATNYGVIGTTNSGVGVRAFSYSDDGTALEAEGTVKFIKCSGLAAVPAGSDRAIVTPPIVLRGKEKVLITLMGDPGRVLLQFVKLHPARGVFTVFLTGPAPREVPFAWFVIS
jgi:hypothetical protein